MHKFQNYKLIYYRNGVLLGDWNLRSLSKNPAQKGSPAAATGSDSSPAPSGTVATPKRVAADLERDKHAKKKRVRENHGPSIEILTLSQAVAPSHELASKSSNMKPDAHRGQTPLPRPMNLQLNLIDRSHAQAHSTQAVVSPRNYQVNSTN